ncbi:MAG: protein phosphatase 2C domain-containing protein [gamma proteobacterium symbiont of Taylorina sp.]|nr:protein phosphatase 2C domain-containing protein [gamma proteobacterium symbiont of Taylorina sp.]
MFKDFFAFKCTAFGQTDIGKARDHNEDNISLNQEQNLFLLADGMGGHDAGEVASQMAVEIIENVLAGSSQDKSRQETLIIEAVEKTNADIYQENIRMKVDNGKGMGTTIVGCRYLEKEKQAIIFNVGDSRAYSYYQEELLQISTDHSLLQLWKEGLLKNQKKPAANMLTKALGPYAEVVADTLFYPVKKGEKLLLCSDGLTTMVSDEDILDILIDNQQSAEKIPELLINKANMAGGEDNISVIIINFS